MGTTLRRVVALGVTALAAVSLAAGRALASASGGDDDEQVVDISHQLGDMQKKLDELNAKGRAAKSGKLAAAADCGFGGPSQRFLDWGDDADYSLIPNGDLSTTTGWSLKNVERSDERDPFASAAGSLLFVKGDSQAVTPVMCVTADHPTLRVFLADRGGNAKAHLEVNVLYEGLDGKTHGFKVARLKVDDRWQPSIVIPIGVNMLAGASAHGWTPVAFEFKVKGLEKGETFALGGVYVDPCRSR
jgi:hypothetical protein